MNEYVDKAKLSVAQSGSMGGPGAAMLGGAAGGYGAAVMPPAAPRLGIHELMSNVENGIAEADKAAEMLFEALNSAGVLRGVVLPKDGPSATTPTEAPMVARLIGQKCRLIELAQALHRIRESLAF